MKRELRIEVFHTFDEENKVEHHRCAKMTVQERCDEFATLQERIWGEQWISKPLVREATWEKLTW